MGLQRAEPRPGASASAHPGSEGAHMQGPTLLGNQCRLWAGSGVPQLWEGKSEPLGRLGACGLLVNHAQSTSTPGAGDTSPDQGFSRALSEKKKQSSSMVLEVKNNAYAAGAGRVLT